MNAIEIADTLEKTYGYPTQASDMLRRQHNELTLMHDAIVKLRGALENMIEHCDLHQDVFCAEQALQETSEFSK